MISWVSFYVCMLFCYFLSLSFFLKNCGNPLVVQCLGGYAYECWGSGFNFWSGNQDAASHTAQ